MCESIQEEEFGVELRTLTAFCAYCSWWAKAQKAYFYWVRGGEVLDPQDVKEEDKIKKEFYDEHGEASPGCRCAIIII